MVADDKTCDILDRLHKSDGSGDDSLLGRAEFVTLLLRNLGKEPTKRDVDIICSNLKTENEFDTVWESSVLELFHLLDSQGQGFLTGFDLKQGLELTMEESEGLNFEWNGLGSINRDQFVSWLSPNSSHRRVGETRQTRTSPSFGTSNFTDSRSRTLPPSFRHSLRREISSPPDHDESSTEDYSSHRSNMVESCVFDTTTATPVLSTTTTVVGASLTGNNHCTNTNSCKSEKVVFHFAPPPKLLTPHNHTSPRSADSTPDPEAVVEKVTENVQAEGSRSMFTKQHVAYCKRLAKRKTRGKSKSRAKRPRSSRSNTPSTSREIKFRRQSYKLFKYKLVRIMKTVQLFLRLGPKPKYNEDGSLIRR